MHMSWTHHRSPSVVARWRSPPAASRARRTPPRFSSTAWRCGTPTGPDSRCRVGPMRGSDSDWSTTGTGPGTGHELERAASAFPGAQPAPHAPTLPLAPVQRAPRRSPLGAPVTAVAQRRRTPPVCQKRLQDRETARGRPGAHRSDR
jgi:hypothetical protein